MTKIAAALAAVLMLSACGGPENEDPGVATYALDATGVHCNAPDLQTEFGMSSGGLATLCRWDCIDYHGEPGRMVTLEFVRPVDDRGQPSGPWEFYGDKSEPGDCR